MKNNKLISSQDNFIFIYTDKVGFDCKREHLKQELDKYVGELITYADGSFTLNYSNIDYIVEKADEIISNCFVSNITLNEIQQIEESSLLGADEMFSSIRELSEYKESSVNQLLDVTSVNIGVIRELARKKNKTEEDDVLLSKYIADSISNIIHIADKELILAEYSLLRHTLKSVDDKQG